jgi:hypothetical protein
LEALNDPAVCLKRFLDAPGLLTRDSLQIGGYLILGVKLQGFGGICNGLLILPCPVHIDCPSQPVDLHIGGIEFQRFGVIFGVGRGYHTREVETFGAPMRDADANRELFEEQFEIIMKAFNEQAFTHKGKHYTLPPEVPMGLSTRQFRDQLTCFAAEVMPAFKTAHVSA